MTTRRHLRPKSILVLSTTAALAACGLETGNAGITSSFRAPASDGFIVQNLEDPASFKNEVDGLGYSYVVGLSDDLSSVVGYAGLNGADLLAQPTFTSSARFEGTASGRFVDRISDTSSFNRVESFSMPIEVTIDIASGRFNGASIPSFLDHSRSKQISFNGTASADGLDGTVRMTGFTFGDSVRGRLTGAFDNETAIAAMHGTSSEDLFVGGFRATISE